MKAQTSKLRPEKTTLLHHSNARPHTSLKTMMLAVPAHPLYSLDLVLSEFHLLRPMKDRQYERHFPSNITIMTAVKQWVTSVGANFYKHGMQTLVHHWRKCIANGDNYAEK